MSSYYLIKKKRKKKVLTAMVLEFNKKERHIRSYELAPIIELYLDATFSEILYLLL